MALVEDFIHDPPAGPVVRFETACPFVSLLSRFRVVGGDAGGHAFHLLLDLVARPLVGLHPWPANSLAQLAA